MGQEPGTGCGGACGNHHANVVIGAESTEIGRRTFLVQSGLMAAAAALAACGTLDISSPTLSGPATVNVNTNASLANVGGVAMVTAGGVPLAIVRTGTTSFIALSRVCPHQGGTINQAGGGFQCTLHGATFNSTGGWIGGQRTSSMHSYNTSYDAATGILTVS